MTSGPASSGHEPGQGDPAMPATPRLERHYAPRNFGDRLALGLVTLLRFFADVLFARRYGHRAIVLETVAAVPGMVGGTLQHLRALRRMDSDRGWIRTLLDEAENERKPPSTHWSRRVRCPKGVVEIPVPGSGRPPRASADVWS